jgi:RHS repeat-associated protein
MLVRESFDAHREVLAINFRRPDNDTRIEDGRLTGIESSAGYFFKAQYASSRDEAQRDQRAGDPTSPLPAPQVVVKRLLQGPGTLREFRKEALAIQEYYYSQAIYNTVDRAFGGFGLVKTLDLGDATGAPSTHPAVIIEEQFHGMSNAASGGSSDYLLGQPILTRTFSTQLSASELASRLESSTNVSVSHWSQHTPLPAPGPERQRDTFTWSLQWTDGTYTEQGNTVPWRFASRRLEQTNHQEFADPLIESASLNETTRYAEFDRFNIPHCVHTERTAINVPTPQGTVEHIPPRHVRKCSEFDAARSALKGWHILNQPARIHTEDLLAQQPVSTVTMQYDSRWGLPVQETEKIYVDVSHVDAKMQGLFEHAVEQERSTYFTYDAFGNLVRIEDTTSRATSPMTPVLQRMYDSTGLFLLAEKNAAQHETLYCYASLCAQQPDFPPGFSPEEHAGRVTHVRSPQGVWSFQTYDRLGRIQKVQTSTSRTHSYAYRYGSADRPSYTLVELHGTDKEYSPDAKPFASVLTAWDARGAALFRVQERDETGSYLTDCASYNAQGDVIASHPGVFLPGIQPRELFAQDTFRALQPHEAGLTTYAYDEEGRLTLVSQSNGYTRHYAHAPWGVRETEHILRSDGVTASTQRVTVGLDDLVFAMIDQEGAVTRIRYDRFGNLAHILVPGEQQARTFVHNSQGELLFSAYPGLGMRQWTRNTRGLAVAMTALNQAGDVVHHIESSFDPLGRVTRLQVDGKDDSLFIYDGESSASDSLPASGAVGHVVSMKRLHHDPRFVSTVSYEYNAESQIARQTTRIGERRFDDMFSYAIDGQLQEVITTDHFSGSSLRTRYHRDAHGRVSGLAIGLPWKQDLEPFITNVGYDAYGAITSLDYANGLHQEMQSDPATFAIDSIKTTQKVGAETHVMQDLRFKTNAKGLVEEIIDTIAQASTFPSVSRTAQFAYSAKGELQKASRFGHSWEYQFNPNGIFARNPELTAVPLQTVLDHPLHLAAPAGFPLAYDALGQIEKAGDLEDAHYNAFGQLTEIRRGATTIQFGYAANGQRLYKRVTALQESITYYPSPRTHIEAHSPEHYIFLGEQRLARVDAINKTWYLHLLDHLGSTDMTVDPKGSIAASFVYTSFGNTIDAQQVAPGTLGYPISPTPYRFAGQYYDTDTGLYVMGARYYQPRLGLFMSPDPLFIAAPRLSIERPLEGGLYTYAGNDPVNYFDPAGLARTGTASRATPTRNNAHRQGTGQRRSPYYRGSWKHGRDLIAQHPAYAGGNFQSDHFPPVAAYRGTQYAAGSTPYNRPAFPLETEFHQFTQGTGGFGGHASSTGSTLVSSGANGYTQQLRGMMRNGDYYGAMKMDIIDKQNVGRMRLNDSTAFNSRMRPGVTNAFERGWITETQFYDLMFNYLGSR